MDKAQARIMLANARALQFLPYRDNRAFAYEALLLLGRIASVFDKLQEDQPELSKALELFRQNLKYAIGSLPTHNHQTTPDPVQIRHEVCNAIVELAKLADE